MVKTNCGCQSSMNPGDIANEAMNNTSAKMVVYINSATVGRGDDDLGTTLMGAYLDTLADFATEISHIILVNSAVKLACRDSTVSDQLQNLSSTGIKVLSCGTCINFFELKDRLAVGKISNMFEIIETLKNGGRTLHP